jgi:hypothetical protein
MSRNKLIEMVVEKLLLAVVASIVLLLFKYYVEIQQNVDEQIFQHGVSVRDAVEPIKSVRDNVITSIGSLVDAIDAHGVTLSTSQFKKDLSEVRSDLEGSIRVMRGLKAALGTTNASPTDAAPEFATQTLKLLGETRQEITRIINLADADVEGNLIEFESTVNGNAELIYSSTAQDLVVGSRIVLDTAASDFRNTVTTSLKQMAKPLVLVVLLAFAVSVVLWAFRLPEADDGG